jgi:hypothetical protein
MVHSQRLHCIIWWRFGCSNSLEGGISLDSIQWRFLWPAVGIRDSQKDCDSPFYIDKVNNLYSNKHTALCHVTQHGVGTNLQIQPTDAIFSIITCTMKMDKYFSEKFVNFYSKKNIYWRSPLWEEFYFNLWVMKNDERFYISCDPYPCTKWTFEFTQ